MQLKQLTYFKTVADCGSINKAAEAMLITQPNLSRAIRTMEGELGFRLFDRTTRGVQLTDKGKQLYQHASSILGQMELVNKMSVQQIPRVLTVLAFPSLTSSRFILELYNQYKGQLIEFNLIETRVSEIVSGISGLKAEVGVLQMNQCQQREVMNYIEQNDLEFHLLAKDTWYAYVGPQNPLYGREEVDIRELMGYTVLRSPDDLFSHLTAGITIDGVSVGETKGNEMFLNNENAVLNLIASSDAFCFGLGQNREDYQCRGLACKRIKNCQVEITVGWIKRKRDMLSPEGERLVALLGAYYQGKSGSQTPEPR